MVREEGDSVKTSDIVQILLTDYQVTRTQIRAAEDWHERIAVVLTLTIVVATLGAATLDAQTLPISKPLLFALVNLLVLSQFAFLLDYHFFFMQLWTHYVILIESKLRALCSGCNVVEFESTFAPLYWPVARGKLPGFANEDRAHSLADVIQGNANRILLIFIHLPSFAMYCFGCVQIALDTEIKRWLSAACCAAFAVAMLVLMLLYVTMARSPRHRNLVDSRNASLASFSEWLAASSSRSTDAHRTRE